MIVCDVCGKQCEGAYTLSNDFDKEHAWLETNPDPKVMHFCSLQCLGSKVLTTLSRYQGQQAVDALLTKPEQGA